MTRALARVPPLAWAIPLAMVLRLAYGGGQLGYDAAWALLWGDEIASLALPSFEAPVAPTPHPLANALAAPLALLGVDAATTATLAIAWLAFAALGVGCAVLGARLYALPVGLLFAALVLTRPLLVNETRQAILDVPFLALLVWAAALEVARPRADVRVPVLLLLAGLLRPEAWLVAGAYLLYDRRPRTAALALAAPVIWALMDLVVTGDPLHSLHGTQELAAELQRPRELGTALRTAPSYLRFTLDDAAAWTGFAGAVAGLLLLYDRSLLPCALAAVGLAAFLALGVLDLPLLVRYLLLPSLVLALFCGVAAFGWMLVERPYRAPWMAASAVVLVALALGVPGDVERLDRSGGFVSERRDIQRDLAALAERDGLRPALARCERILLPDHRPRPLLAWWLDRDPEELPRGESSAADGDAVLAYATPRTSAIYSVTEPPPPAGPEALPPGARATAASRSWLLAACPTS